MEKNVKESKDGQIKQTPLTDEGRERAWAIVKQDLIDRIKRVAQSPERSEYLNDYLMEVKEEDEEQHIKKTMGVMKKAFMKENKSNSIMTMLEESSSLGEFIVFHITHKKLMEQKPTGALAVLLAQMEDK